MKYLLGILISCTKEIIQQKSLINMQRWYNISSGDALLIFFWEEIHENT